MRLDSQQVRRNWFVCNMLNLVVSANFGNSYLVLFCQSRGLTFTQIAVYQTVFSVVSLFSDTLFGRLADYRGIRFVATIGFVVAAVSSIGLAVAQVYWQFLIVAVGFGVQAGAILNISDAVMTLTLDAYRGDAVSQRLFNLYQVGAPRLRGFGYAGGVLTGAGLLAVFGLTGPYVGQPAIPTMALVLTLLLVKPPQGTRAPRPFLKVLRVMLVDRRDIRYAILLYSMSWSAAGVCFWLLQSRMEAVGIPRWTFGLVFAAWALALTPSAQIFAYCERKGFVEYHQWGFVTAMQFIGCLGVYFIPGPLGVVAYVCTSGVSSSIFASMAYQVFLRRALGSDNSDRNTELAVSTTVPTLVYAILSPVFGWLTDITSVQVTYLTVGVTNFSSSCIILCLFRKADKG